MSAFRVSGVDVFVFVFVLVGVLVGVFVLVFVGVPVGVPEAVGAASMIAFDALPVDTVDGVAENDAVTITPPVPVAVAVDPTE